MTDELREFLRGLLLPIEPALEEQAFGECGLELARLGVRPEDHGAWLRIRHEQWRDAGVPEPEFKTVVCAVLSRGSAEWGGSLAQQYFDVHLLLVEQHLLEHADAGVFLSHLLLVLTLARHGRMSASQISQVLGARDGRLTFRWKTVQAVLNRFASEPSLVLERVRELVDSDRVAEAVFADADLDVATEMVANAADRLGYVGGLPQMLGALAPSGEVPFAPYLQILHYQCVIAEFYDHAVSYAYEFRPRGLSADWLFRQYPAAIVAAANPFLNNVKAVQRIDQAWAEGRDDNVRAARALAGVLSGMESMGFAAKRELATWLRRWLHRVMLLNADRHHVLPPAPAEGSLGRLLGRLRADETRTRGIIEQRVCDALTLQLFPVPWRAKGLGESVNATNVSSRKFGDVEYQDSDGRRLEAFEVHAGGLSQTYLDEHLRTLAKSAPSRVKELQGIADLDEWRVTLTFIAHRFEAAVPPPFAVSGLNVVIVFETFDELIARVNAEVDDGALSEAFSTWVHQPLNDRRTPNWVREKYAELTAAGAR